MTGYGAQIRCRGLEFVCLRTFSNVTLTSLGAAIYNTSTTPANMLILVLDFGGDKTATSGDFTIQWPANTATDAIIRLGD